MVTAAAANYERVSRGLRIVQGALAPLVFRELTARYGGKWWAEGVLQGGVSVAQARELPRSGNGKELIRELDAAALLNLMTRRWDVFKPKLRREDHHLVAEVLSWRNRWAHHRGGDMSEADAWRALDTMQRLLEDVDPAAAREIAVLVRAVHSAPGSGESAVAQPDASSTRQTSPPAGSSGDASRPGDEGGHGKSRPLPNVEGVENAVVGQAPRADRDGAAVPTEAPTSFPISPPRPRTGEGAGGEGTPAQESMAFGLRPWREVITPHADVAAGRYYQAEFAADLAQVLAGKAEPEYGDPVEFFARTYLTEGMSQLLVAALKRLGGEGGEPVIQIKTAFGGGKTHTMLALYHLLKGRGKLARKPAIEGLMAKAGVSRLPKAAIAVLVGTALSPDRPQVDAVGHGIETRTLWGEMAAQLGGKEGYEMVRAADERGVAPGSNALVELLDRFGPCVILIDELVAYARNVYGVPGLPSGSFDSIMSFIQALTEAVKRSKRSLLVASLPESNMEIGGEAGQIALEKIEHTFGRLEAVWKPVAPQEGFEIVRRRLFGPVKDEEAREQTCLAYSRLYSGDSSDFPKLCGESAYLERMRAAYPIHPEVFDRLYDDWNVLPRFQRTRGVLRLMAAAIHELWVRGNQATLIEPGDLPLDAPALKDELLRYLPDGWNTVLDRDVDGPRSEPRRIDEENPRFGVSGAAERLARTIFLGTAPHGAADEGAKRVRGMEDVRIRLGVATPGGSIAVYNDALGRLTERLTYLNSGNRRYWFDTHPNLLRTAQDRAHGFDAFRVDQEIEQRLRRGHERGEFRGIHWFPERTGSDVPDERTARLVVLKPGETYSKNTNEPEARTVATKILEQRGNSPRQFRNMLAFVAADDESYRGLTGDVRLWLAWKSIYDEREQLNLDAHQRKQAQEQEKRANETIAARLHDTYAWLLVPGQELRGPWTFEITRLTGGDDGLVARASRRMVEAQQLIASWSPALLKLELDRRLWREQDRISLRQLWEFLCTYGYLPRLRDESVLQATVAEGVRYRDYFGYAASVSASGRYEGLIFGEPALPGSIHLDEASVLVRPGAAEDQIAEDRRKEEERAAVVTTSGREIPTSAILSRDGEDETPAPPPRPQVFRRYHASVKLNPIRLGRDAGQIAEEIIQQLAALPGAEIEVTLDIAAEVPDGVPEDVRRIVTENGNTLRFESQGFEEE